MASSGNLPAPANDLRSEAREYQRDRNHNAKWARGSTAAAGKKCSHLLTFNNEACSECAARPQHRDYDRRCGRHFSGLKHNWNNKNSGQKTTLARKVFRNEVVDATDGALTSVSDSSGEEDLRDAHTAPIADADVMYSFDAARGPGHGSELLSHAVSQAIQRYENKETEKLAREYEFVDGKDNGYAADADEDDFELIDHTHLD